MNDKISIVIPVYNAEKTIRRCVDSVLKQTHTNIEIILVDDGSKDESFKICDSYRERDSRIVLISQENQGPYKAKFNGIQHATGQFIAFVDSDDYIPVKMYEELFSISVSGNYDIVESGYQRVDSNGKVIKRYVAENCRIIEGYNSIFEEYYSKNSMIVYALWSKLFKRELFRTLTDLPYRKWDDVVMLIQVFYLTHRIFISNKIFYNYVENPSGIAAAKTLQVVEISKFRYQYHIYRESKWAVYEAAYAVISAMRQFFSLPNVQYKADAKEILKTYYSIVRQNKLSIFSPVQRLMIVLFRISPDLCTVLCKLAIKIKRFF